MRFCLYFTRMSDNVYQKSNNYAHKLKLQTPQPWLCVNTSNKEYNHKMKLKTGHRSMIDDCSIVKSGHFEL